MGKGMVAALTHASPLVRGTFALGIGLAAWLLAWTLSYRWLPEQTVTAVSLARHAPIDFQAGPESLGLAIFAWNAAFGGGAVVLASLFAVGRLPLGVLAPWVWMVAYGVVLGTNSFAFPSPFGKIAPHLEVGWEHIGLRELGAYLLVAVGLANAHLWRYASWGDWRLARVRRWSEVRLAPLEVAFVAAGVALLAWSAFTEAGQIALLSR